ncbi:MAG: hypothetical protein KGM15_16180 [Pseudomonadota bacterium]|nr:hypothetical protein [Pseudomonadota bacterium]
MEVEPTRLYRLTPPGRIACDADGLRIGDLSLLTRDAGGDWTMRPALDLNPALSEIYGFPVDIAAKRVGLSTVASALNDSELARAQVATLFLHLPEPPDPRAAPVEKRRLALDLASCGLLKVDADWDAKHPRTGTAPNPGWFATTTGGAGSLMAQDLSSAALRALETMATRFKVATIVLDTLFVPSANPVVEQGAVPGRSDMTYTWAHDERQVVFHVLIDGQWRTLVQGERGADNLVRDAQGNVVGRVVGGPRGETLVADLGALDRAARTLGGGEPPTSGPGEDRTPKLCPDPTPEPKTTTSANSIAYQEYVSGLTYGLAIEVGGVYFDGCDPTTGKLLEAKANIDFMFDANNQVYGWVNNNPESQMIAQALAAQSAGRSVVWHAQTEKGYLALSELARSLSFPNLSVVFDPN